MSSYIEKELDLLSAQTEKAIAEKEQARRNKLEEFNRIQQEIEEEMRQVQQSVDFHRELYAVKSTPVDKKKRAFIITFKDHPDYMCLVFASGKERACTEGQRTIRDMYFPMYSLSKCPITLFETRSKRVEELDSYTQDGKVPIPKLLQFGFKFECCACHTDSFSYHDYMTKRCYIIEGEGDPIPYAVGAILCRDCYNKYCS